MEIIDPKRICSVCYIEKLKNLYDDCITQINRIDQSFNEAVEFETGNVILLNMLEDQKQELIEYSKKVKNLINRIKYTFLN